jgi:hypothetical protein
MGMGARSLWAPAPCSAFASAGRGQVLGPDSTPRTVLNAPVRNDTEPVATTTELSIEDEEAEAFVDLASELREWMVVMKANYIGSDGVKVDYEGMKASEDFDAFAKLSEKLRLVDMSTLSESGRKAAYINLYNSLTLNGIAVGLLP